MNSSTFIPPEVLDTERLEALNQTELLDTSSERAFDRLTDLVQRLLNAPVALVSLVDKDRQFFKSSCGLPEPWATSRQTPLSHSFCKHVVSSGEPLVVENATLHETVRQNLAIRDLGVVAYVGIPLSTPEGHVLGSLCAIDSVTREWSPDDIDLMNGIAESVMNEIAVRLHTRQIEAQVQELHSLNVELNQYASELKAATAMRDRVFAIVRHDLHNLLESIDVHSAGLIKDKYTPSESSNDYPAIDSAA
ncbi:MAG: GAF domain-containing protein [Rhodothermales bacterium]|nr:GAF domain-containing protein [Rhodothermales bacterium]